MVWVPGDYLMKLVERMSRVCKGWLLWKISNIKHEKNQGVWIHSTGTLSSHSWQFMSEQKSSHEVEGNVRRAPRQNSVETDLGMGTKTFLQHWRSPWTQWPPSFLIGISLEPPRLWPPGQTEQLGEKGFGDQEPDGHPESYRVSLWRWDNLSEGQPSLQHSTSQAFMVDWPDHSSVKGTTARLQFAKKHLKTLRLWETRFSGLMKPRLNSLAWMPNVTSGGNLAPSLRWSMVMASCCVDVFQRQGRETSQDRDKDERSKVQRDPWWKPAPER